jgi:hypothetical protein
VGGELKRESGNGKEGCWGICRRRVKQEVVGCSYTVRLRAGELSRRRAQQIAAWWAQQLDARAVFFDQNEEPAGGLKWDPRVPRWRPFPATGKRQARLVNASDIAVDRLQPSATAAVHHTAGRVRLTPPNCWPARTCVVDTHVQRKGDLHRGVLQPHALADLRRAMQVRSAAGRGSDVLQISQRTTCNHAAQSAARV